MALEALRYEKLVTCFTTARAAIIAIASALARPNTLRSPAKRGLFVWGAHADAGTFESVECAHRSISSVASQPRQASVMEQP